MNNSDFVIKKGTIEDAETIYNFIYQLAEYEKLTEEVTTNAEELAKILFAENTHVHTIIGFYKNKPVGFALYFYNFSTFKGKTGLYLEDLFVIPEMRGKGFGKILLIELAKIAKENNCARFEWSVLDWNKPAIDFYKSLGANPMDEWTVFRLTEDGIEKLIN
ncbi:MAG: GNAT family N-acetyltransferase [Bacteroidetes bacterium]|nr:GNAT family N-acetyltransferase [Bacteroidota bacterium]MBU1116396.1 GNAT family N-acetyltransferase [Bacteroidota bacterium]MBU1798676.1 GNAT family N-acetyltransferase [Bacteroidota bacterium]